MQLQTLFSELCIILSLLLLIWMNIFIFDRLKKSKLSNFYLCASPNLAVFHTSTSVNSQELTMRQENNPRRRVKCTLAAACSGACLPAAYCMERKGGRKEGNGGKIQQLFSIKPQ